MVVGAFPVIKLGALLMKQLSKPIANFAKERAKSNYFFRTYVCMPPAQFYNWCEIKTKMWVMNLGKPVKIPSLNEAMAIELGANMLGETIVFSIAAGILYFEYARQAQKELAKERARQEEISTLNFTIQQLYFQVERQDAQMKQLLQAVSELEDKHSFLPRKKKNTEPSEPAQPPPPLILPETPLVTGTPKSVQNHLASQSQRTQAPTEPKPQPSASSSSGSQNSTLFKAISIIADEFLPQKHAEYRSGLVSRALEYVEEEVFRFNKSYMPQRVY